MVVYGQFGGLVYMEGWYLGLVGRTKNEFVVQRMGLRVSLGYIFMGHDLAGCGGGLRHSCNSCYFK